jgi:hypothetical protein
MFIFILLYKNKMQSEEDLETYEGDTLPAIAPVDYKGTQAAWMVALQSRGLWSGKGWYGDVWVSKKDWWEILEECESE